MKISVILAFLFFGNFASSEPHRVRPNDKSVKGESYHANDGGSDSSNFARTESSDEASSGKDWGGEDRPSFWHRTDNTRTLARLLAPGESAAADEETEGHGNRAKRDSSAFLWGNPFRSSVSQHLLKLSEASRSNVLGSEKATVAEALNGRAAIRRILERAKARAAKAVPHKDLYDSDDFGKWLLSGSSFDTNIFRHSSPAPEPAEAEERSDAEDSRHRAYSSSLHAPRLTRLSDPTSRRHRLREGERASSDAADIQDAYATRWPRHRQRLSPGSRITAESRDETDGMFPSEAASRHAHRSLSREDDTGLRYYLHAYAPHMRFRATEGDTPRWKRVEWTRGGLGGARALHSAGSLEFEPSEDDADDGDDDDEKRFVFRRTYEGFGGAEGGARAGYGKSHEASSAAADIYGINRDGGEETELTASNLHGRTKLGRKRYYYGIGDRERSVYGDEADAIARDGTRNRHLADLEAERTSPREENIRKENKQPGAERSAIYPATSAETTEGVAEGKQSADALITSISADTPARKAVNIDTERYRPRDRNAEATSLSPSSPDEAANNAIDDGSAAAGGRRATDKSADHGVLRRTRPVIDNDAAAAGTEMDFGGIKNHLPWARSSRSKTHRANQGAAIAHAIASADMGEDARGLKRVNKPGVSSVGRDHGSYDLGRNEEVNAESSATSSSLGSERRYDLLRTASSDDSRREDYAGGRQEHAGVNGGGRVAGRYGTSMETIGSPDRSGEEYVFMPEFPFYEFRLGYRPYRVNYYDFDSGEARDDEETDVGESNGDFRKGDIYRDDWEKEALSDDDETSTVFASSAHRWPSGRVADTIFTILNDSYGRYGREKHGRYELYDFKRFLHDMSWSFVTSHITDWETWRRYIVYLYYMWKLKVEGESDASFEDPVSAEDTGEQDSAIDGEISSGKHVTDEDNHIHLRKHEKRLHDAWDFMIKNGLTRNKIKSIKAKKERTSREGKEGEGGKEAMSSEDNASDKSEEHQTLTRAKSADSTAGSRSDEEITDNDSHRPQDSRKSLSLKDSADADAEANDADDPRGRSGNVDIDTKWSAGATESGNNLRRVSTSSTSRSYARSRVDERAVSKSENIGKIVTQTSGERNEYQVGADSYGTSATSSGSTGESQIGRMHRSKEQSRIDRMNAETLTEAAASSSAINKSRSNVRDATVDSVSSARATSTQDGQESVSENASSSSTSSAEAEVSNYSASAENVQMSVTNSIATSSASSAKSGAKAEQTRNNSRNIQASADANTSSTAVLSNNSRNEWSVSSSMSSEESRAKSDYHLTNRKNSAISRISKDPALSDTAEKDRRSHLQRSFSSSSSTTEESQARSQQNSNSVQNSRMNVATVESSMASSSTSAESDYWSDSATFSSSESLEESQLRSSSDAIIKLQRSNAEDRSESKSASSLKSHSKNKYNSSVREGDEKNAVNVGASSEATSSVGANDDRQQESISSSASSSSAFAESRMENRNTKGSMSSKISSNVTDDTSQRCSATSQATASKDDRRIQEDPQTISRKFATDTNDNKREREDNAAEETRFVDSENKGDAEASTSDEIIEKEESTGENASNMAASTTTTVTSTGTGSAQNATTTSSSIDSEVEARTYSENLSELERREAATGNSATSRGSGESDDNDRSKLLRTSSASKLHGALTGGRDVAQNSRKSMAVAKASAESTVSSNNVRSRGESAEQSALFEFSEEARQGQRSSDIRREKSESSASEATFNAVNNRCRSGAQKDVSSAVSYKELQTDGKLRRRSGASTENSVETLESASLLRNNEEENVKRASSYDYRDDEREENEINSGDRVKYPKDASNVHEAMSTGSASSAVSDNASRNDPLRIPSDNPRAESLRENQDKSDIHPAADGTEITSSDGGQARGDTPRKLVFPSNSGDEARMTRGDDYDATKKLATVNGDEKFEEVNLREIMSPGGSRGRDKNVERTTESVQDATDGSTSIHTGSVDIEGDPREDSAAGVQDAAQLGSTASADTRARSESKAKSSISREKQLITTETGEAHVINAQWRTKQRTTSASSTSWSSHAETQSEAENTSRTEASAELATSSGRNGNSAEGGSIREESLPTSRGFRNYDDLKVDDPKDAARAKASAETSIPASSPTESQDDAKKQASAMSSQLKRHDSNVQEAAKATAWTALLSTHETESDGMQNAQKRKLSGFVSDAVAEAAEVTASESREESAGVSSESDSRAESLSEDERGSNAASRRGLATASAAASVDPAREIKDVLEEKLASAADATASARETSVITDESGQSAVTTTTTTLLSNSRAEARAFSATKDSVLRREGVVNSVRAAANTATSGETMSSRSVQDSSKTISHDESRMDSTRTLNAAESIEETVKAKAASLVSAAAAGWGEHVGNLMREQSNADPRNRGVTTTEKKDPRNSEVAEAAGQATSSEVKNDPEEKNERESRLPQEQRLITVNYPTASSSSETFSHADSIQENNVQDTAEEFLATSSSDSRAKFDVQGEGDRASASATARTMTSYEFGDTEADKSLQRTSSSDADAQATAETTNDPSAVAEARREAAGKGSVAGKHAGLSDLLSDAAARMRTISREDVIRRSLSQTWSSALSEAREVESATARVLADYESRSGTGSGDQRDEQGDASSSGIRDSRRDVMKSTSSANSYAAARTTSEGIAEGVEGVRPSGWLVTTSDAAACTEESAQNKDKLNASRQIGEVAVFAETSGGAAAAARNIESEQREEAGGYQGGLNVATKVRNTSAAASAETITSMKTENESESEAAWSDEVAASWSDGAETRIKSDVSRDSAARSSATSATSSASASTSDVLATSLKARYRQIGNGMSAIVPPSNELHLSSGGAALYPSREISKCDENVETREFISEATSLQQMLEKQRGSEILLMKKNPRGPVQVASLKNSVPPLVAYRLIPREVYERIRAIIASERIFCASCALSSA
ncbi:uncharacterized protein LOC105185997 [Harpegnathos saltator]|uniref:Uncharacterized protein n=1 Tax=Harpegnathos saltator TaxID=610380 RepID=E2BS83_HARSA|nr:uncharacterized protein LOC105185997 [Harpegnathos saltator]EFN81475.1 hypothetical protein EAI_16649 [Harpegnathos saltator]